ncbi:MAG TPA: hypothetical protein H9933_01960 [Candidatus Alistipes merdavium]|nr:hypothetical protein [Candidatus Alistipes merdavium]
MSSNFEYHKLYMPSACPENDTTEGLAFLSDDSKIQISQGPRQKKRKNETVAVTISFYLCRDLIVSVAADPLFVGSGGA